MVLEWPDWWTWPLEFTPHLYKRMEDRAFDPLDVRSMLESAHGFHADFVPGRWVINTRHRGKDWEVVVEPDPETTNLVVITAYATGE